MATYYADLDIITTGDGTELSPWGLLQFCENAYMQLASGSIVKVRGSRYIVGIEWENLIFRAADSGPITFENWGTSPTSLFVMSFTVYNCTLKNFIVEIYRDEPELGTFTPTNSTVLNCFINVGVEMASYSSTFKGCTLIGNLGFAATVNTLQDCIIDDTDISDASSIVADRCVFTDVSPSGSLTNCQTGWTPPIWPSWNSDAKNFNSLVLSILIETPPQPGLSPYTGYEAGLWGAPRLGIGAMYFVPDRDIYYVDLDLSEGVIGDASELSPWNYEQFSEYTRGFLNYSITLKVKGTHEFSEDISIYPRLTEEPLFIESWTNEPIRIKSEEFRIEKCWCENLIVDATSIIIYLGDIYTCYLHAEETIQLIDSVVKGTTLISPQLEGVELSYSMIQDSVIDADDLIIFDGISSSNCVYTAATIPAGGTHTDYQTRWTPPVWPEWDDGYEEFNSVLLSVGIEIPPQPGSLPYTDYETGLWGTSRLGIGAMWFFDTSPRYWVSPIPGDFISIYWSTTSGGSPGASVPGASNAVIFDAGGQGDCTVNADISIYSLKEDSGYYGTINQDSGSITTGDASFLGGALAGTALPFTVQKNLVLSEGFSWQGSDSTICVHGDVYCNSGFLPETHSTVCFTGLNKQALHCNGGVLPNVFVDKNNSNQIRAYGDHPIYIDGDFFIFDGTFNTHGHDIIISNP